MAETQSRNGSAASESSACDKSYAHEKTPLALVAADAVRLISDLHKLLMNWIEAWKENGDKETKLALENAERCRRRNEQIRDKQGALGECADESRRVIHEIDRVLEQVQLIERLADEIGLVAEQDCGLAVTEYTTMSDFCVEHERICSWLRDQIVAYSKDLSSFASSSEESKPKPIRRTRGSQPIELNDGMRAILDKAQSYRRMIELNGGTRPKATTDADILNHFAYIKMHAKNHTDNYKKKQTADACEAQREAAM